MKLLILILIIAFSGVACKHTFKRNISSPCVAHESLFKKRTNGVQVAIVINDVGFCSSEHKIIKYILESKNISVDLFSNKKVLVNHLGKRIKIKHLVGNLDINKYQAIIFIGAPICDHAFKEDFIIKKIVKEADRSNKLIAGIGVGAYLIATTGILKGRKATTSNQYNLHKKMKEAGVIYTGERVTVDKNVITAFHPTDVWEFTLKLLEKL